MATGWVKIAVHVASQDPYAQGFREVMDHFGLRPEYVEPLVPSDLNRTNILILAGPGMLPAVKRDGVTEWVKNGGCLICCGSSWGLDNVLGVSTVGEHASHGTMVPVRDSDLWPNDATSICFAGGTSYSNSDAEVIATYGEHRVGVSQYKFGHGKGIFIAANLGQTLLQYQIGRSVECDGLGSSDGSAKLDDGILRAEDGTFYDFDKHREKLEDSAPHFAAAHADRAKELLFRAIIASVEHTGQALMVPWFWPEQSAAAAILTLECSDANDVDGIVAVHRMLAHLGASATWSIELPGYSGDIYRTIRAREHEMALLFSFDESKSWVEERLRSQATQLGRMASEPNVVACRPKNGGWYRRTKFYEMCELAGTRISISKGGRQPGTMGFLFGTCHPFFPPRADGNPGLVMEIPYTAFQVGQTTSNNVADAIIAETKARHGCFHFVQPPSSFADPQASNDVRRVITNLRMDKVVFLKPSEAFRYEKARRQIRVTSKSIDGELHTTIVSDNDIPGFSVILMGVESSVTCNGKELTATPVTRFGKPWRSVAFELDAKRQVDLSLKVSAVAEAA